MQIEEIKRLEDERQRCAKEVEDQIEKLQAAFDQLKIYQAAFDQLKIYSLICIDQKDLISKLIETIPGVKEFIQNENSRYEGKA